jgi:hypothetical protein
MYHTNTGSNKDASNSGVHFPFVSAWEKNNGTSNFALKYGNANSGGLTTTFSGPLPNGYSPMKTDSSLLLGTGGDNSVTGIGYFFEGAITSGYPSDATENAVQSNITAAGYSFGSGGSGSASNVEFVGGQSGRCLDVTGQSTTNGTPLQIWDCSGNTGERFTSTSGKQLQVFGNKCLDANNQGNANGTITGVQSGLCLDANGAGTANGTKAILWACNGGSNQQWTQHS